MQKEQSSTQVGPGQAGESHTATAVSPHRILGGATNCTSSSSPCYSARPAADSAPKTQAATHAPIVTTPAATNAPTNPTTAATHAPIPTTSRMPPASIWQQSIVRNSVSYPDDDPGDLTTLPGAGVRLLKKRGKTTRGKKVGDRKRYPREGTSQREARSDAEELVRDQPRVRDGETRREKGPDAENRERLQVREGETQREKRPNVGLRDRPQIREGETQREKRPDAEPRVQGQVREGATQREKPMHPTESAGGASRPYANTDTSRNNPRPKHRRGKRGGSLHPNPATLPGTSKSQPGPSGTGPAKRDRPDDTASPGTLQGDAKRVRIHSAQEEPRTYARATKDIPARLAVAICFPPPSRDLTAEEAEQVKVGLVDLLMGGDPSTPLPSTPLPAFRGYPRVAEGTVQMWCEDDYALTWLTQNVPKIKLPDTDVTLTVLRQSDVPTRVRASLFVPRYRGDVLRLHNILIRQNTWYDIARWSMYRATRVGGENYGTYLTLGLPPTEAEKVLGRERRISYLLGSIYVRFWPTAQPKDCTTDTEPAPTGTRTEDTEIAQLEEVMARAAMADVEATIPPTSPGWSERLLASSPVDTHDNLYREGVAEELSDGSTTD